MGRYSLRRSTFVNTFDEAGQDTLSTHTQTGPCFNCTFISKRLHIHFANSTVQKTSKMSIIIDTIYHKAALALPNVCLALEKLCSLFSIIILNIS